MRLSKPHLGAGGSGDRTEGRVSPGPAACARRARGSWAWTAQGCQGEGGDGGVSLCDALFDEGAPGAAIPLRCALPPVTQGKGGGFARPGARPRSGPLGMRQATIVKLRHYPKMPNRRGSINVGPLQNGRRSSRKGERRLRVRVVALADLDRIASLDQDRMGHIEEETGSDDPGHG